MTDCQFEGGFGPLVFATPERELPLADAGPLPSVPPAPTFAPLSPGTYLRKRREAARLGQLQAGASMAAMPWSVGRRSAQERARCAARLAAAERDDMPFSRPEADQLRNIFAFDVEIYFQLLELHFAGPGSGLPQPQVCRSCACSWHDACETASGPCAWTEDPELCSACGEAV